MRVLVVGLKRELPLSAADALDIADKLVARAANAHTDGRVGRVVCVCGGVGVGVWVCVYVCVCGGGGGVRGVCVCVCVGGGCLCGVCGGCGVGV